MNKEIIYLGEKYWSNIVIDDIIANDFDFNNKIKKMVVKRQKLCECGKFGINIIFEYEGRLYSFDFLTGYPCECDV